MISDLDRILIQPALGAPKFPEPGKDLRVVSWNIERGIRRREIIAAMQGPLQADLYLLQEVDWNTRRTGYGDVSREIAESLGFHFAYAIEFQELAQNRRGEAAYHGQAIMSRFPLCNPKLLRFRHQPHNWGASWRPRLALFQPRRGGRIALRVEMQWNHLFLVIYNTHLESRTSESGRARQSQEILDDLLRDYSAETPVIFAGDLNTRQGHTSPVIRPWCEAGFSDVHKDQRAPFHTKAPARGRADWILVRNIRVNGAGIEKLPISDHYPLWTTVREAGRILRVTAQHTGIMM